MAQAYRASSLKGASFGVVTQPVSLFKMVPSQPTDPPADYPRCSQPGLQSTNMPALNTASNSSPAVDDTAYEYPGTGSMTGVGLQLTIPC
jgi:hypothetical protein